MRAVFLVATALIVLPGFAQGESFSVPLPELVGVIDFLPATAGRTASFDFGQHFSAIEIVQIEIEAHVFAREFDVCGTAFNPQPCVHKIQLLGLFARLDTEGHPVFSGQGSGGLSFGAFGDLESSGVDTASFGDQFIHSGFNNLFDGQGSLILFWNTALGNPDRMIRNLIEPSGEILSARLIVTGTPIPEPSTATLVGLGLLVLATIRRRL